LGDILSETKKTFGKMKKYIIPFIIIFIVLSCKKNSNIDSKSESITKNNSKILKNKNDETEFEIIDISNDQLSEDEIIEYVSFLKNYMYQPNEKNIDVDDLSKKLSKKIVNYINNQKKYDLKKILNLDCELKDEKIQVYSFGYDCGGTRGYITFPILKWIYNNKTYSYNLSEKINCEFEKITKLNSDLYLFQGFEKGYSNHYQSIVYVIKIKNDSINVNYEAFSKRPYLNFYNCEYLYNTKSKILKFQPGEYCDWEDISKIFYYEDKYNEFAKDSTSAKEIYNMIFEEYNDFKTFHLKFNGKKFEAITN